MVLLVEKRAKSKRQMKFKEHCSEFCSDAILEVMLT